MAKSKIDKVRKLYPRIKHLIEIEGYSHKDLIEVLPIGKDTFYKYIREFVDFSDLLEKSTAVLLEKVENAFIKNAIGFEYEESKEELFYQYNNGVEELVNKKVTINKKRYNGNTQAQLAVLRRLGGWREEDYTQTKVTNDDDLKDLTKKDKQKILTSILDITKPKILEEDKD